MASGRLLNGVAQKEMAFEKMCHGWALGTKDFKRKLLETEGLLKDGSTEAIRLEGKELQEVNELQWEAMLERALGCLKKTQVDIDCSLKSADWKIWIAHTMRQKTSAPNVWIANKLNMGAEQAISMHTGRFASRAGVDSGYKEFILRFTTERSGDGEANDLLLGFSR